LSLLIFSLRDRAIVLDLTFPGVTASLSLL